mgnify:FL=1
MASEIRVDKITSLSGVGTITPSPTGIDIAGITTAATLKATTGIVTTLTATTGIVTTFEATTGNITTLRTPTGIATHFTADKISLPDSSDGSLCIGIGSDLKLNHNGTDSFITEVGGGDLYIQGNDIILRDAGTLEKHIEMTQNGAVDIYHNGTKRLETTSGGAAVSTTNDGFAIGQGSHSGGNVRLDLHSATSGVGCLIRFANDHNGDAYIGLAGDTTGDLLIYGGEDKIQIQPQGSAAVELYHGTNKKFETQSDGATLTGDLFATSRIFVNTTDAGESNGDEATFANTSGNAGITIRSAVDAETKIYFSEGTSGGSQYRGTINYNHNTNYMSFATNENERIRILSGGGITFNGDTATANALDDYEEGTWTPRITAGGTAFTVNDSGCQYVKVGALVFIEFDMSQSNGGPITSIFGLPFGVYKHSTFHLGYVTNSAGSGQGTSDITGGRIDSGANSLVLHPAGGSNSQQLASGQRIIGSGCYITTS